MNNGYRFGNIPLNRGLIQGDPLSQPLFCLMAEPLANAIREHNYIKGYHLPGCPLPTKLCQYADDTNTITTDELSIQSTLNIFQLFEQGAGCALHPDKIKGMTLHTNNIPHTSMDIKWNEKDGLKILGIVFFNDPQDTQNYNWLQMISPLEEKYNYLMPQS